MKKQYFRKNIVSITPLVPKKLGNDCGEELLEHTPKTEDFY